MTHFEYISVAVSLIYSLALAKLLGGLPAALQPGKRYWVHSLWIFSLLSVTIASWWHIWWYRDAIWNPTRFLALLFIPSIIYLRAAILLSNQPHSVSSWRTHYYNVRRPFFLLQVLGMCNYIAAPWVIIGVQLTATELIGSAFFTTFAVVAAFSDRPRLHEILAVISLIGFALGIFNIPDAFTSAG